MLAIADGGSTKADWKVQNSNGETITFTSTGFNPNYNHTSEIASYLKEEVLPVFKDGTGIEFHYYGSGCWDVPRKKTVSDAFKAAFPDAEVHIYHDLLAAARATCGTSPGIACILGTGSNTVLYDGNDEVDNVTNLGFLLGDEGSGAYIGKEFVKSYFYREMPEELRPLVEELCPNGKQDILDKVYGGGVPAAYLASYTKQFAPHTNHPFVFSLIKNCFDEFLIRHVFKYEGYKDLPIHFIGSIAFHFYEILETLLDEHGLKKGIVLQKPIDNLFKFHQEHLNGADSKEKVTSNPNFQL